MFCTSYGLSAFTLSEPALCCFVAFLVHQGMAYSSIRLYLSALRHHQLIDCGEDPALDSLYRLHYVLRGCHRSLPSMVRVQWLPITPQILRLLHEQWSERSDDYSTVCAWATCCVAFFAFLRCGEFTCRSLAAYNHCILSLQDVTLDSRSEPTVVHLTLRYSKTDIFGAGVTIHLGRTNNTLRPVSALLAYLARRPPSPGPLFLLQSGQPLSREFLVSSVQQTLASTRVDVS